IILAIGYVIIHLGDIFIDRLFLMINGQVPPNQPRSQRTSLRFSTFSQVAKSILVILVVIVCSLVVLATIGIDLGPLLASAGIIGLALSLASQSLLKDIINGFMILMEDHYGIGDVIIVGDMSGFVETMNLRITQLRNEEGRLITIPNGQINVVQNLSKEWSRVDLKVPVALDSDINQALELIKQVADDMSHDPVWQNLILEEPVLLGVDNIDHIGATIRLWIKTLPLKQWDVAREYRRRLKIAFSNASIDFGLPKQVVQMANKEHLDVVTPSEH
ncbi:MAG: mechanosensitive ion channel family protein, partial [Leptolyngbya sp. SIO3F4]|nr:mechanosensitive ion channel family protein [Leptolyngbya sp. SIO3F4]